ncbi:MAG: C39 family peptidase [Clostridia bacterium]|nr:C39 family peptidase [Clostridia bacterium]
MKKLGCFILLIVFVFTGLFGCSKNEASSKNEGTNDSEDSISNIIGEITLDKDLAEVSHLNGIVKIDSIASGLDTFSFDTILLDLEKGEKLCEVSFAEGAWVSGLTENGFYAVNMPAKELKIYDKSGNITKEVTFSGVSEPMHFCALSENEKYFVYTNPTGAQATVIHLTDNSKNVIDLTSPPRDLISFKDNVLKLVSIGGEVFELDVTKASYTLVLADKRIHRFSSHYCLGETENNFLLENAEGCSYVPLSSADEIVVGLGESGFATTCVSQNKNHLRFYDLNKKTISYYDTTESVEQICYVDDQTALAVTGSPMEKRHKIILCKPTSPEELTVLSRDIAVNTEPEHSTSQEVTTTPSKLISNVPAIHQFPQYPTGCESVAAVMALRYGGNQISVEQFVEDFLPKSRDFYVESGMNFGPSPYEYFIGNPKSAASYGCMAPVIEKALLACIGDSASVNNLSGMSLEEICDQYIDQDIPVIMWATINMLETNPKNSWYLSDGTRFTWPGNEHCMLLVGYDDTNYYFNDPYVGKLVAYDKTLTEDRFAELGRQALAVLPQ